MTKNKKAPPPVSNVMLPELTDEQLQEFRELVKNAPPGRVEAAPGPQSHLAVDDPSLWHFWNEKARKLAADNDRLRKIVSDCAAALGNGAAIAPFCSLEFMEQLPKEVTLVIAGLRAAARAPQPKTEAGDE